ncbi:MAG: SPFH domain-containing protein [Planctomycetota bacterium]
MAGNTTEGGGGFGCFAAAAVALVFCGMVFLWTCYTKVPANTIGVRTLANGGIEKMDYGPGYVLCIPGLHQVKLWDPTWTNVYQHMEVRGSDQYKTSVDVSVILRIHKDKCHDVAGKFQGYERIKSRVLTSLSQYANEILTQMKTEDFYNAKLRDERTAQMQKLMDTQLEELGLEVKSVLLRNIIYDPTYEEQLLKKQLAGQTRDLEDALTKQTIGETETELIGKQADAEVLSIKEKQDQEIANLKAEMDQTCNKIMQDAQLKAEAATAKAKSDKRANIAKADTIKAEATAAGTKALSRVYAKPGASYYFAQKALAGIKLGNIELNSNTFNPLETDKLLKALGLDLHVPQAQSTPAK